MAKLKLIDEKICDYISEFTSENGYSPSVRDIQSQFGFASTSTVVYHLKKMESYGMISKVNGINRTLKTIKNNNQSALMPLNMENAFVSIPLIGDITAGKPILAEENYLGSYYIPTSLFQGENLFMLNVHGESMINAGIHDGDKLIIRQQSTAENGEIVAAMLDNSATVKRFFKEKDRIRLQPENPTMSPIYCENVQILGKVVGLIRKL